jgi:hypothetical protein
MNVGHLQLEQTENDEDAEVLKSRRRCLQLNRVQEKYVIEVLM